MATVNLNRQQQERVQRIVWPLLPALLRTARYLTRHEQEAEDLAQETANKAMPHIDSFKDGTDAKAWLMAILRRTHIDAVRVAANRPRTFSLNGKVQMADPMSYTKAPLESNAASPDDPQALLQRSTTSKSSEPSRL